MLVGNALLMLERPHTCLDPGGGERKKKGVDAGEVSQGGGGEIKRKRKIKKSSLVGYT